ncbi:MAG: hypothetical protein EZS28_012739 [Streblomastix strix]|uniref:Uncharacterized protein n=1 Tax=Streblomastix strix TaxID=222440 RepID=A0A5J4WAQ5_9EUKA|nr:MAG: hypothetical protein EZS28_012739 [Streblomastix strix]
MHANDRRIIIELGSNADILELDKTYTTRLLERKGSGNDKQRQRNKSYLLRATPFRASLQEDARSGSLDTFRQHNISLRYWEIESDGMLDRKNKTNRILEMGQRMKDKDQKLLPGNVGAFFLDMPQKQEEIFI